MKKQKKRGCDMWNYLVTKLAYVTPKWFAEFFSDVYCLKVGENKLSVLIQNKLSLANNPKPKIAKTIEWGENRVVIMTDGTKKEFKFCGNGYEEVGAPKFCKTEPIQVGENKFKDVPESVPPELKIVVDQLTDLNLNREVLDKQQAETFK